MIKIVMIDRVAGPPSPKVRLFSTIVLRVKLGIGD